MKKIFFYLLLFPSIAYSQKYLSDNLQDTSHVNVINLDVAKLRDRIYSQIPANYKEDKRDRQTFLFAHNSALEISELMSSGQIYTNMNELETYLNEILKKIMPAELKSDTAIHVFIIKDGDMNSQMEPTGQIIFNIGTLAEMENEAMIACMLAHEMAHFYLKHSIIENIKLSKSWFGPAYYFRTHKFSEFLIDSECAADSLAENWINNSGYDLKEMKHFFEMMTWSEKQNIAKLKNEWKIQESTHPLSDLRLEATTDFIKRHEQNNTEKFLVSEIKFNRLKEESKAEVLNVLLKNGIYERCIEKAFVYHIIEPMNKDYIYYLMEATRRLCYSDVHVWNYNFLTYFYYDSTNINGVASKVKTKKNLFSSFNPFFLSMNQEDTIKIKARFYWEGEPKFTTYEQAFEYFYEISQKLNINECILSNALSVTRNNIARNRLLEKYLSRENIKYREFASSLLNDSLYSQLDTTRLLILADFSTYLKLENDYLMVSQQPRDSIDIIQSVFDSISKKLPGRKFIRLSKLKESNLNDYFILNEMHGKSFYPTVSHGDRIELPILDPENWYVFKKYNVNEIEFIMCDYSDAKGGTRTVGYYKDLIDKGNTSLFYPPQHRRYMDIYITCVRMKKEGALKYRYFYSTHFGNIAAGVPDIIEEISSQVNKKDEASKKYDKANE
jgi:hypothetical protein